jgi:hypothetical protein
MTVRRQPDLGAARPARSADEMQCSHAPERRFDSTPRVTVPDSDQPAAVGHRKIELSRRRVGGT